MKEKIKSIFTLFLFFLLFFSSACQEQKTGWKGTIEYEHGVKVVKNPKKPFYGEIEFELKEDLSIGQEKDENYTFYKAVFIEADKDGNIFVLDGGNCRIQKFDKNGKHIQTIGKRGQGSGEFQHPNHINLDSKGNIYVRDMNRVHKFNKNGEFVSCLLLSEYKRPWYGVTKEGNFLGMVCTKTSEGMTEDIVLESSEEGRLKTIKSYPVGRFHEIYEGISIGNPYSGRPFFCPLNQKLAVYGHSYEYKLFIINSLGDIVLIIEKDEPTKTITKEEKDRFADNFIKLRKRADPRLKLKKGDIRKRFEFLKHKPFFSWMLKDDIGRIYISEYRKQPFTGKSLSYDLFNNEGYYLYRVKMPSHIDMIIKNGNIYRVTHDPDTGYYKVKRYKIKNWEQIKAGF